MSGKRLPIVHLPKAEWAGHPLPIGYTTEEYYDVTVQKKSDGYGMEMKKCRAESPIIHTPEEYDFPDKLYEEYWDAAWAWGVVQDGRLLAAIETDAEEWSNRLRVTELWVSEELRGQGYGHALMELAKERARRERRRAVILETQSCNANAIGFYEHEGFTMIGFDSCCYSNRDLERKEVRIEMGWFPQRRSREEGKRAVIRQERPEDWHQTEEMTQRAFWNEHNPGCNEHYLVHKLREDETYLPEFSRVAELDGKVVGCILYSRAEVMEGTPEQPGRVHEVVTFGPLCVDPDYQGCGIGERLVQETLPLVREAGYPAVVIFGEPDYYPRLGFQTCDHYGITTLDGKNFRSFLCYELIPEKLAGIKGRFREAEVFETLEPEETEEYNKQFPPLEKQKFPGQWG